MEGGFIVKAELLLDCLSKCEFGPFCEHREAEECVKALAARDNCFSARIEQLPVNFKEYAKADFSIP